MIAALITGGLLGAALCFLAWTLIPSRTDHTVVLGRLDAARTRRPGGLRAAPSTPASGLAGLRRRSGTRLATLLDRHGIGLVQVRRDLAIQDKSFEDHLGGLLAVFTASLFGFLLLATLAVTAGIGPAGVTAIPLALILAAAITLSRHNAMRRRGAARRRQFRRAVEVFQDLVGSLLLAGTGLPEALPAAAGIGTEWPFRVLDQTLERSRAVGRPAWEELSRLGDRFGVDDLRDLAPALALVGEEGARVADTLFNRSSTMRRRDIADINGRAKERDVSMRIAIVGCGIGFMILLIYPLVVSFFSL